MSEDSLASQIVRALSAYALAHPDRFETLDIQTEIDRDPHLERNPALDVVDPRTGKRFQIGWVMTCLMQVPE